MKNNNYSGWEQKKKNILNRSNAYTRNIFFWNNNICDSRALQDSVFRVGKVWGGVGGNPLDDVCDLKTLAR